MMIDAVIWDFGGVLTTSPFEAFARFEVERGLPADIIRRTNAPNGRHSSTAPEPPTSDQSRSSAGTSSA
jgi:FMN phosphatase YigB (HAD superfamily)